MTVVAKLSGDTTATVTPVQTSVVDTEDGVDLSTLITHELRVTNSDGHIVDVTLLLHLPGEDTTPIFSATPSNYRVTVESI